MSEAFRPDPTAGCLRDGSLFVGTRIHLQGAGRGAPSPPSTHATIRDLGIGLGYVRTVHQDRPDQLQPQTTDPLDVLWVSTVAADDLHPHVRLSDAQFGAFLSADADEMPDRPVHGTLTVDVRDDGDRRLLERLLNGKRVLSVTAADGWSQRVRLTGLRRVDTEETESGDHLVVATYTWVAAASFN